MSELSEPAETPARIAYRPDPAKEGTLLVAGFFGRGNAGDEAMLQCIFDQFAPRFNIMISVDGHGAFDGFWDWHPYCNARVVHQSNLGFVDGMHDAVGMLVGGGGLPIGFAGGQVFGARAKGMPVVLAGVDVWEPNPDPASRHAQTLRAWLDLFDYVVPRTATSVAYARAAGADAMHGGDWALMLPQDQAADVLEDPRRALVVLREDELARLPEDFVAQIEALLTGLEALGWRPVWLPFCPEDERFIGLLDLSDRVPTERSWWNARRLKQLIGASGLTVSVGRLHPMIFGADCGRKLAAVIPPSRGGEASQSLLKLFDMGAELGIACHGTIGAFVHALATGGVGPADPARVAAAKRRLQRSIHLLHGVFRRPAGE